ncbi:MAG: choice-of-anchor D domain-containing protein [Bacteroidales bacterium]|nr:choice-of-anchor D domain-containing protein [Bacteroidales bacterium]
MKKKHLLLIFLITFLSLSSIVNAQNYHPDDIAVLQSIMYNNFTEQTELNWQTESDTSLWNAVTWTTATPKRISELFLSNGNSAIVPTYLTGSIDVTALDSLELFRVDANEEVTSINVSGLLKLEDLRLSQTMVSTLDASGLTSLYEIHCREAQLTSINVDGCTSLDYIKCQYNLLTELDFTSCTNITDIECSNNSITSLLVNGLDSLVEISCASNKLTSFDASNLKNLEMLHCKRNNLTSLNVTGDTSLIELKVSYNSVQNLDLSTCKNLEYVYSGNAGFKTLNVKNLANLQTLKCHESTLDTLDITGCSSLDYLTLYGNKMFLSDLIPLIEWPSMSSIEYDPQIHKDVIDAGGTIDYSIEAEIDGNTTTFTLYDHLDIQVDQNTTGLFTINTTGIYNLNMNNQGYEIYVEVLVKDVNASTVDLAILQAIIDNNFTDATGLNWETEIEPFLWDGCDWDTVSGRLLELNLSNGTESAAPTNLSGSISAAGLDSLELFRCDANNNITAINVSGLENLLEIRCSKTDITTLDLSGLTKLENIYASSTKMLESINTTGCDSLYEVHIYESNIASLDFSGHTNLYYFDIYECENLITIDVSGCTDLYDLYASYCYSLESINLTGCTSLNNLDIDQSNITNLDISDITTIYRLDADDSKNLESINASGCTGLQYLYADECKLSSIDLTNCTALIQLDIEYNYMTDLDATGLTSLNSLNCYDNLLETLDVTGLTSLTNIYVQNNKLPLSQAAPAYNLPSVSNRNFSNQMPYDPVFMAIGDSVYYEGEDTIDINGSDIFSTFTLYDNSDDSQIAQNNIGKFIIDIVGVYYVTMTNSGVSITTELITVIDGAGIEVTITNEDFGTVDANSTSTETLTIYNPGNSTLNVTDITLPAGFSVTTSTYAIAAEAQEDVLVTFSPTDAHLYFGSAIVHSNATGGDSIVTVKGKGTTRIIELTGTMAFGNVDVGNTADATLTISNSGDDELDVTNITLPTGFTVSATSTTVAAGGSQDVTVTFTPTDAIAYSGDITVTSNAISGTNTIAATGTGMAAIISLSGNMTFGDVDISTTADATLTISNTGNAELSVTDITLPTGFTVSTTTVTVAASGSEDVTVTFNPTATTTYSGDISVTSDAISGTSTIAASGTGIDATGIDNPLITKRSVYPNPAVDKIYLKGFQNNNTIKIYNAIGALVLEKNLEDNLLEIDISEFRSGIYFIKSSNIKETIKFIKE